MNGSVLFEGNPILSGSLNVNTDGNIEPLEVEITENGTREITPPSGVDGYAPITIKTNVPQIEPVLETLNVTQNGRYEPPSGVAGFDEVNVEVLPPLDTLTVTENGSYEPPTGVYGFSNVNVNVPTPTPTLETLNITQNGTYTTPSGVDGYDKVNVNVPLPENAYLLEEYEDVPTDIASFTASDAPLKSLTVSIEPVQTGSGDPSPTNIRPISGWTEEVITVTDDLQNPTITHTTTIPFTDGQGNPVEVYGGTLDVTSGVLTITWKSVKMNTLNWFESGGKFLTYSPNDAFNVRYLDTNNYPFRCSEYTPSLRADNNSEITMNSKDTGSSAVIRVKNTSVSTVNEFEATLTDDSVIIYELATPITIQLTPTSIKSLDGENNLSASTGDVKELKFYNR